MVERNKRFVYGTFYWPTKKKLGIPRIVDMDRVAVEVIRDYGANELVGKIYTKGTANQWIPLDPSKEGEVEWFSWYKKFPPGVRNNAKMYYFDMEGSGRWAVLHFRNESDESGTYVAVALRYSE